MLALLLSAGFVDVSTNPDGTFDATLHNYRYKGLKGPNVDPSQTDVQDKSIYLSLSFEYTLSYPSIDLPQ